MKTILAVTIGIVGLGSLVWLGLKINPAPFHSFPQESPELETIPLPSGLPAPVERFYRKVYGDRIPVIHSVVFTGRAAIRPFGFTLPARFRFTHDAGRSYRHYIEATFFGFPVLKINERFLEGESLFELPFGVMQKGPKLNQAANLGMWAELLNAPSVYLTDPRVRWEAIDNTSAMLVVPFEDSEEHFAVRFDPNSGLVKYTEVMRYQDENSPSKSLWITEAISENVGSATWFQDGKAWAVFTTEETAYNVDIHDYIRAKGQ